MMNLMELRSAYRSGTLKPRALIENITHLLRAEQAMQQDPAWICLGNTEQIEAQLLRLEQNTGQPQPLHGIPFAIKDNIDVEGWVTTAACPAFAHIATRTATAVQKLMDAGAILIGKTNLDQFATGLVGTRSPYGAVPNTFDPTYVSGGSSSGSASVVARGLVCFSLGTDTAGSGRVPAGFNNIVGMKPTPGIVSIEGVLPACQTLDCVSIFAGTAQEAQAVLAVMQSSAQEIASEPCYHPAYAVTSDFPQALRIGIPSAPEFFGNAEYEQSFAQAISNAQTMGAHIQAIDFSVLIQIADLLYNGPWVAERYVTIKNLFSTQPEAVDPTVRAVVQQAEHFTAADSFEALYQLKKLTVSAHTIWSQCDVLMVPTSPRHPSLQEVAENPVLRNSELGTYTNFVNLLGMSAIAMPSGLTASQMPFGVTFIAPGGADQALLALACNWQSGQALPPGAPTAQPFKTTELNIRLAVVGAHLQGMPLHQQLADRACRLVQRTTTSAFYQLYALADTIPPKPGLVRTTEPGTQIELEVYEMPSHHLGSFLQLIPSPLGLGSVELADGTWVKGFICEPWAIKRASNISHLGGWRAYISGMTQT